MRYLEGRLDLVATDRNRRTVLRQSTLIEVTRLVEHDSEEVGRHQRHESLRGRVVDPPGPHTLRVCPWETFRVTFGTLRDFIVWGVARLAL